VLEIVAIFSAGAVDDGETMDPLIALVDSVPGLELTRYDLNQMEHWRSWDPQTATIDALTQRTQVLRAEGSGVFFFALGKHGETPTAIIRAEADIDVVDIRDWFKIDRLMQLRLSSEGWRSEHDDLPQVWAWRDPPAGAQVVQEGAAKVCRIAKLASDAQDRLRREL
jgi:hypothetical protein